MRKILITGANSYLAKNFIDICKNVFYIIATTTTKNLQNETVNELIFVDENYEKLKPKIKECDFIVHFAWSKKNKDNSKNLNYINFLLEKKNINTMFYFISSVAGSPNALSVYGKQKYEAYKLTLDKGGNNIILGGVISAKNNQIKTLLKLIYFSPFSIRFSYNFFKTYNIELDSFKKKLFDIIDNKIDEKNIIMFDQILDINDLFQYLEKKYEIKRKYKLIIPVILVKIIIYIIKKFHFSSGLIDKILTFTYKDDEWLNNLQSDKKHNM